VRADAQRLYRALVLLWARVERVLLSETSSIPEAVIKHVSKQLGLSPAVLLHLRNPLPQWTGWSQKGFYVHMAKRR
jgi:hypothetical protein